ncbi:cupin domain-containing protein [Paenibacillus mesotrionivorans]|uniref:Cupin domain-containing protein n=1 Tax=Paenibacillus mesotrionivorans TaxID=3160968 RepID=A0ACC7NYY8_9BACL
MEYIKREMMKVLSNPGCESTQLLWPGNSSSERVTITEVRVAPGGSQPRHQHKTSEQIWYAVKGKGKLLIVNDGIVEFVAGDVVRFSDGDTHGLLNDSPDEFIYISVTSPPLNFKKAYQSEL